MENIKDCDNQQSVFFTTAMETILHVEDDEDEKYCKEVQNVVLDIQNMINSRKNEDGHSLADLNKMEIGVEQLKNLFSRSLSQSFKDSRWGNFDMQLFEPRNEIEPTSSVEAILDISQSKIDQKSLNYWFKEGADRRQSFLIHRQNILPQFKSPSLDMQLVQIPATYDDSIENRNVSGVPADANEFSSHLLQGQMPLMQSVDLKCSRLRRFDVPVDLSVEPIPAELQVHPVQLQHCHNSRVEPCGLQTKSFQINTVGGASQSTNIVHDIRQDETNVDKCLRKSQFEIPSMETDQERYLQQTIIQGLQQMGVWPAALQHPGIQELLVNPGRLLGMQKNPGVNTTSAVGPVVKW